MSRPQVALENLLGRMVLDCDGVKAGRIHDVEVEVRGGECLVREWYLGVGALRQRLGVRALHLLGIRHGLEPVCVPWQQMDLSDPERPRLRCRKDELPGVR